MFPYIPFYAVFIWLTFVGLLETSNAKHIYGYVNFLSVLFLLCIFATLRSVGVGSDDDAYMDIFSRIPSLFECHDMLCGYDYSALNVEFGFFSWLSFLSVLGKNHFLLFGGVALPSIYLYLKAVKFYTPFFGASVLVFFSHFFLAMELNAIRIGLASAIVFFSIKCISEKKYWYFLVLFITAITVHVSMVLALIPIALFKCSPTRSQLILLSAVVIAASGYLDQSSLAGLFVFVDFLSEKGSLYQNAEQYSYSIPLYDLVNLKNIFFSSLCLMFYERLRKEYQFFEIAAVFFISATLLRILLGNFAVLAGRGYSTIAMFDCVVIPMLAVYFVGRLWGFILVSIYAFSMLWLNIYINGTWSGGIAYFHDIF